MYIQTYCRAPLRPWVDRTSHQSVYELQFLLATVYVGQRHSATPILWSVSPIGQELFEQGLRLTRDGPGDLVYNCRSSASWSGDRALSATFFPGGPATYAVMFGYDREQAQEVIARLLCTDEAVFHPMILPTMFAEMERDRQITLVRSMTTSLAERVYNISISADDIYHVQSRNRSSITLWTRTSYLRDGLHAFKRQIIKMIEHLDDLPATLLDPSLRLSDLGARITTRLRELVDEYDEHILRCTTILDGMSLATQLVRSPRHSATQVAGTKILTSMQEWNNIGRLDAETNQKISGSSLDVAYLARKDGRLMKSIAVVTLLFLPATFLAVRASLDFHGRLCHFSVNASSI